MKNHNNDIYSIDDRAKIAIAYWLDCSPHERTEEDGIILAKYARGAMSEIERLKKEKERLNQENEIINTASNYIENVIKSCAISKCMGSDRIDYDKVITDGRLIIEEIKRIKQMKYTREQLEKMDYNTLIQRDAGGMTTVKMTITANVKVTSEVREGVMLEYGFSKERANDDELVARAMLYAYLNPKLYDCTHDYWWDGVANLKGLISDIEFLEES